MQTAVVCMIATGTFSLTQVVDNVGTSNVTGVACEISIVRSSLKLQLWGTGPAADVSQQPADVVGGGAGSPGARPAGLLRAPPQHRLLPEHELHRRAAADGAAGQ